jgi:hypothetical protein
MRLVMTLLVRDEEDVLRENIEFHRAQGVDFFIVTDNKSEDTTPDIIREYEQLGIARYIFEGDDDYNQTAWVTRMARMAATEFSADWVINNDADEFWWPRGGDLKSTFAAIRTEANVVVAPRHDFVALNDASGDFYRDMIYRKKVSLNTQGKPLPPKVAHRGDPQAVVEQGNHWVELADDMQAIDGLIDIFHFPLRSYTQFTNKIIKGGQAYQRNQSGDENMGRTWKKLYEQYQQDGLVDYYRNETCSPQQITQELNSGALISDHRLADYLDEI